MSDESAKSTAGSQGQTQKMDEIEALIEQFYSAFGNRPPQVPNFSALRARFAPRATITLATTERIETWTADEFILPRIRLLSDGTLTDFHEWEVAGKTVLFDQIASRCSEYRKSGRMNGEPYEGKGRKFIQLCSADGRWLISSILWEDVNG